VPRPQANATTARHRSDEVAALRLVCAAFADDLDALGPVPQRDAGQVKT
jgi:hypothetical protein